MIIRTVGAGRLQVDEEGFAALVEGRSPEEALDYLTPGDADAVRRGLRAVADPVLLWDLALAASDATSRHRLWLRPECALALMQVDADVAEVMVTSPQLIPALVARTVRLGPRPRLVADEAVIDLAWLNGLTGPSRALRRAARDRVAERLAATWPDVSSSLAQDRWLLWRTSSIWPANGGGMATRETLVLDTPRGALLVDGVTARVRPTTSTDLWMLLAALLPSEHELATVAEGVA
jgi:hypothetical protein